MRGARAVHLLRSRRRTVLLLHNSKIRSIIPIFVYRMEFDKTRWSCPWNSDQNCIQNSAPGRGDGWDEGVVGVQGMVRVQGWGV